MIVKGDEIEGLLYKRSKDPCHIVVVSVIKETDSVSMSSAFFGKPCMDHALRLLIHIHPRTGKLPEINKVSVSR